MGFEDLPTEHKRPGTICREREYDIMAKRNKSNRLVRLYTILTNEIFRCYGNMSITCLMVSVITTTEYLIMKNSILLYTP